jgi:hypothetical protein
MKTISVLAASAAIFLGGLSFAPDANAEEKKKGGTVRGNVEVTKADKQSAKNCLPGFYLLNGSCVSNSTVPPEAKIKKGPGKSASGSTASGS